MYSTSKGLEYNDFNGIAIGFLVGSRNFAGFAIGGAIISDNYHGIAIGGLQSLTYIEHNGVQISAFNWAGQLNGVQIGLSNYTESLQGIQIGILNIVKDGPGGAMPFFPIINVHF